MNGMRRLDNGWWSALTGGLLLGVVACTAGETRDAPEGEPETGAAEAVAPPVVAEGTSMVFRVDETISTGSHEVGDAFTATLAEPVLATDGSVALPAGTRSRWVVTESGTNDGESLLAFGLQSVWVAGTPTPLEATVTGTEIQSEAGDTKTESAAKVAVGTAAGAIIGQILGRDTESTLTGAGVGAVVGTVVALTTRDGEARLAQGSTITVRLDQRLEVG